MNRADDTEQQPRCGSHPTLDIKPPCMLVSFLTCDSERAYVGDFASDLQSSMDQVCNELLCCYCTYDASLLHRAVDRLERMLSTRPALLDDFASVAMSHFWKIPAVTPAAGVFLLQCGADPLREILLPENRRPAIISHWLSNRISCEEEVRIRSFLKLDYAAPLLATLGSLVVQNLDAFAQCLFPDTLELIHSWCGVGRLTSIVLPVPTTSSLAGGSTAMVRVSSSSSSSALDAVSPLPTAQTVYKLVIKLENPTVDSIPVVWQKLEEAGVHVVALVDVRRCG